MKSMSGGLEIKHENDRGLRALKITGNLELNGLVPPKSAYQSQNSLFFMIFGPNQVSFSSF